MKKTLLLIPIALGVWALPGQILKLTGTIRFPGTDSVELNTMPFGTSYFKDYSRFCPPDEKGNFDFAVKGNKEKFVLVRYAGREEWLLLSPGRPLSLIVDTTKCDVFAFSGKGGPENRLLRQLSPKELYFRQHTDWGRGTNPYMSVSEDSMRTVVFPMVMRSLDSSLDKIREKYFRQSLKDALSMELRFYYFLQFALLAWEGWHASHLHIFGFFHIIDTALAVYGIPSKKDLDSGIPAVYDYMIGGYLGLNQLKASFYYGADHNKLHADQQYESVFGFSHQEYQQALDSFGHAYASAIEARHFLPAFAVEKKLAGDFQFWLDKGDLLSASLLLKDLIRYFPRCIYIKTFSQKIAALQRLKDKHLANPNIHFRQDYRTITSIKQLVEPYKGKVVYLDFWGTWCPYCLEEIQQYSAALRERYKGKDVIFLYVALDDDADREKWEDYIYLYDMEGEHVRMPKKNASRVYTIRDSLDMGEKEKRRELYPTYYIFDREGNPAVKNSKQPSDGAGLYKQIDAVLEIPHRAYLNNWEENTGYTGIHIRRDYRSISSLEVLISPYRGKTVYLDIWGTWCGPCVNEMSFASALQARFKDSAVVFLYVDEDEEADDEKWRSFIDAKSIAGEHVRMTGEQIRLLWDQLRITGESYPSYFIFDSQGKLVVKNARRPSDGEALYEQIKEESNK